MLGIGSGEFPRIHEASDSDCPSAILPPAKPWGENGPRVRRCAV